MSIAQTDAPSILIVDDDQTLREQLARAFGNRGFDVRTAAGYEDALGAAREDPPELAVVDLKMSGRSGLELVRDLRALGSETKILMLTGYASIATAIDAMKLGAIYYLSKPADVDDILAAFARGEAPALESGNAEYPAPSLERVKWEHINLVLANCGGNVSEAARRLKLHRRTLQRMLQKYPPEA